MAWDAKVLLGLGIGLILASAIFFSVKQGTNIDANINGEDYDSLLRFGAENTYKPDLDYLYEIDDTNITGEEDKNTGEDLRQEEKVEFEIEKGTCALDTSVILSNHGLIDNKEMFMDELKERDKARRIKYGAYEIRQDIGVDKLIEKITWNP